MSYPQEFINELSEDEDQLCKQIYHQKRKRCLAMAKWCKTKATYHFVMSRGGGVGTKDNMAKDALYTKWQKHWLDLAEEPTWAKFMQLIRKEAK